MLKSLDSGRAMERAKSSREKNTVSSLKKGGKKQANQKSRWMLEQSRSWAGNRNPKRGT